MLTYFCSVMRYINKKGIQVRLWNVDNSFPMLIVCAKRLAVERQEPTALNTLGNWQQGDKEL